MPAQKLGQHASPLKSGVGNLVQRLDPGRLGHLQKLHMVHGPGRGRPAYPYRSGVLPQRLHHLIQILIGGVGRHSEAPVVGNQLCNRRGILLVAQGGAPIQMDQADRRGKYRQHIVRAGLLIQIVQREPSPVSGPVCDGQRHVHKPRIPQALRHIAEGQI